MSQKKITKLSIDIILPNYNSELYINDAVQSVINQTYKNWKLYIVDGNSNKKTKDQLLKFKNNKKIKIIWVRKNNGQGYNRNLGIKKSSSNYVAFIDSDDIWKKNKLEKQINFMIKNKYKFSYTGYSTFTKKNKIIKNINPPTRYHFDSFIKNTTIATSTMMLHRNLLKNIKFTSAKSCDDYYFKCKILKNIKFVFGLKDYLTQYRISENSANKKKLRNIYWVWKINRQLNKLSFVSSLISLLSISLNSFKKYGFK
jgi:teichuronic acid biosynthesis glycosyltransferase TuaG